MKPTPPPPLASDCAATKQDGTPCRARVVPGREFCRWHDTSPEARERHREESRRGGESKAYGSLVSVRPIADDLNPDVDMGTADGGRQLLAVALARLAELPFDLRVAHAVAQLVAVQRTQVETTEIERRLDLLEGTSPILRAIK